MLAPGCSSRLSNLKKNRHNTKPKVSCYTSLVFIYLVAAILGDHHNEMVAMLMGIEFFSSCKNYLLFQEICIVADHYAITGSRAVTKISSFRVYAISRPGIEQLRSSFGSISLSLPLEPQYNLNIMNLYITNSSL